MILILVIELCLMNALVSLSMLVNQGPIFALPLEALCLDVTCLGAVSAFQLRCIPSRSASTASSASGIAASPRLTSMSTSSVWATAYCVDLLIVDDFLVLRIDLDGGDILAFLGVSQSSVEVPGCYEGIVIGVRV